MQANYKGDWGGGFKAKYGFSAAGVVSGIKTSISLGINILAEKGFHRGIEELGALFLKVGQMLLNFIPSTECRSSKNL